MFILCNQVEGYTHTLKEEAVVLIQIKKLQLLLKFTKPIHKNLIGKSYRQQYPLMPGDSIADERNPHK